MKSRDLSSRKLEIKARAKTTYVKPVLEYIDVGVDSIEGKVATNGYEGFTSNGNCTGSFGSNGNTGTPFTCNAYGPS